MTAGSQLPDVDFEHDAFVYGHDDEYVAVLAPLLTEAVDRGDTAIAAVPRRNIDLLAGALDGHADDVRFIAAEDWYRRPMETIARYDDVLRRLPQATRAFVVGEVQFGQTEHEWHDWTRYEAALNRAFSHHNAHVVCPYDSRALPPQLIDAAEATHRHLVQPGQRSPSERYVDPAVVVEGLPAQATVPPGPPDAELIVAGHLTAARRAVEQAAAAAGFDSTRVDELVLGAHEVVSNAVRHGGGGARLRLWSRAAELVCVVEDDGDGMADALLGYVPPLPGSESGFGLWLARQAFDGCQIERSPSGGSIVVLVARS